MNQERLETLKAFYASTAPNLTLDLIAEVERLQAEVERLKAYTDPRLFAAASNVLQAWDEYADNDYQDFIEAFEEGGLLSQLAEAVAWWDSLPFDPDKDIEQLPKYEG